MMSEGDLFKYDVRVRERMLRKGILTEEGVKSHLDGLADRNADCETSTTSQPALGRSEEALRVERAARALEMQNAPPTPPMVRATAAIAPAPAELDDDDDDDDDDIDEPEAELAGATSADADEADDDEADDDEADDDEADDDEADEPAAEAAPASDADDPASADDPEPEKSTEDLDDDWGAGS